MRFGILYSSASHLVSDQLVSGRYKTLSEARSQAAIIRSAQPGIRTSLMETTDGHTWMQVGTGATVYRALTNMLLLSGAQYEAQIRTGTARSVRKTHLTEFAAHRKNMRIYGLLITATSDNDGDITIIGRYSNQDGANARADIIRAAQPGTRVTVMVFRDRTQTWTQQFTGNSVQEALAGMRQYDDDTVDTQLKDATAAAEAAGAPISAEYAGFIRQTLRGEISASQAIRALVESDPKTSPRT